MLSKKTVTLSRTLSDFKNKSNNEQVAELSKRLTTLVKDLEKFRVLCTQKHFLDVIKKGAYPTKEADYENTSINREFYAVKDKVRDLVKYTGQYN